MSRPIGPRGALVKKPAALYADQLAAIDNIDGSDASNLRELVDLALFVRRTLERRRGLSAAALIVRESLQLGKRQGLEECARRAGAQVLEGLAVFVLDLEALTTGGLTLHGLPARAAWDPDLADLRALIEGPEDLAEQDRVSRITLGDVARDNPEAFADCPDLLPGLDREPGRA